MAQIMNIPIDISMNIYQIINTLVQNKGINVKKLYAINKEILENDKITIKHIYCKNRTHKNNLCLNKCINESKYCSIHDPIMRENRIINRRNMNIRRNKWKKESKEFLGIDYELGKPYEKYEPSAPPFENIINPPEYTQKPDECGKTIIDIINSTKYNIILDNHKINEITKSIESIKTSTLKWYKDKLITEGNVYLAEHVDISNVIYARNKTLLNIKDIKDNNGNILPILDNILLNTNNKTITDIEEYKDKLRKIDYQELSIQYKGLNIQRLYRSTIELQFKLLLSGNTTNTINSTLLKFITKLVKKIPK